MRKDLIDCKPLKKNAKTVFLFNNCNNLPEKLKKIMFNYYS